MALVGYHPSNSLKTSQRTFFDVLYGFYTGPSPLLCFIDSIHCLTPLGPLTT